MSFFKNPQVNKEKIEKKLKTWQETNEKHLKELDYLKDDNSLPLPDPKRKEAIRKYLIQKYRQIEPETSISSRLPYHNRKFWKVLSIAAVISTCLSITAFAYYREFVLMDYGTHTDVNVYTDEEEISERILTYYYKPNYIPEGFQLADEIFYDIDVSYDYFTENEDYLLVSMWTANNGAINTEDMDILPRETINGFKCTLYSKGDKSTSCIIIDHIDCFVYIYGDLPPDEIVKIAENLEPIPMPDVGEGYSNRYF